jgi:hypothetical protein
MTARVPTNLRFCACVSMHQSGQSIARSVISSVKITKAAQCPQMEASPGFGLVDLLIDHCSECPHSEHCHLDKVWNGRGKGNREVPKNFDLNLLELKAVTIAAAELSATTGALLIHHRSL